MNTDCYLNAREIVKDELQKRVMEAQDKKTDMECLECGKKFKGNPDKTVKCPKCGGSDIDIA